MELIKFEDDFLEEENSKYTLLLFLDQADLGCEYVPHYETFLRCSSRVYFCEPFRILSELK